MTEIKLAVNYDEFNDGKRIEHAVAALAATDQAAHLESLIIGDWGEAYERGSEDVVRALVEHAAAFPNLKSLFIGEMSYEECEISWIVQSNLSPVLEAFPHLRSLTIQGSQQLRLHPLKHEHLEKLVIICGGLPKAVLQDVHQAQLPNLHHLELYIGVDDYGFDGGMEDLLPFVHANPFPKLSYLGLKNSSLQDELAIALADAPLVKQLEVLDLSKGELTDRGAEALLGSEVLSGLKLLDLNYHYMSAKMMKRLQDSGIPVNVSEQQQDEDDYRAPYITE